ncbi:MAG: Rnf-Nqr domain containing protein [Pseudohongiellaceae bacterium]
MTSIPSTLIAAALVNNLALVHLVGVSSLLAYSARLKAAGELAVLSFISLSLSGVINLLLYRWLLQPFGLDALSLLSFTAVSATLVSFGLPLLHANFPLTARRQLLATLLLSANSAVIGLSLLNTESLRSTADLLIYCIGAALGFSLCLLAFAALRQRIDSCDAPRAFRRSPLYLISAGIAAMAMLGFAGLI